MSSKIGIIFLAYKCRTAYRVDMNTKRSEQQVIFGSMNRDIRPMEIHSDENNRTDNISIKRQIIVMPYCPEFLFIAQIHPSCTDVISLSFSINIDHMVKVCTTKFIIFIIIIRKNVSRNKQFERQ